MASSYINPNTGEPSSHAYNRFGTTEGEVRFGDVMKNGTKMSVMIRRIFPSSFSSSHYIGLVQNGRLDGSIINRAPATYQVICGEKPVDGIAGFFHAENGDLVLSAPNGRIRIIARDIDLYASGNGTTTGWINLNANSTIDSEAPTVQFQAQDALSVGSERDVNINVPGEYKISCGNFKVVESPDVSPITSPFGSGANTILQTIEGIKKLIESIR